MGKDALWLVQADKRSSPLFLERYVSKLQKCLQFFGGCKGENPKRGGGGFPQQDVIIKIFARLFAPALPSTKAS